MSTHRLAYSEALLYSGVCHSLSVWSPSTLDVNWGSMVGKLDEVRVSSVTRSTDWLDAQYLSQSNSFNIFGAEQTQ